MPSKIENPWRVEEIETIKRMIADGASAGVIAHELVGRSRSAIIGKCHRDGIVLSAAYGSQPSHGRATANKRLQRAVNARRPTTEKPAPAIAVEPNTANAVRLIDVAGRHCRFPLWGDSTPADDRQYCGERHVAGSSYCEFHRLKARSLGTRSERAAA